MSRRSITLACIGSRRSLFPPSDNNLTLELFQMRGNLIADGSFFRQNCWWRCRLRSRLELAATDSLIQHTPRDPEPGRKLLGHGGFHKREYGSIRVLMGAPDRPSNLRRGCLLQALDLPSRTGKIAIDRRVRDGRQADFRQWEFTDSPARVSPAFRHENEGLGFASEASAVSALPGLTKRNGNGGTADSNSGFARRDS